MRLLIAALLAATSAVAGATSWPLSGYTKCASLSIDDVVEKPFVDGAGLAYESDQDVLWIASGPALYKLRYSNGEALSTLELGPKGDLGMRKLAQEKDSPTRPPPFGITSMGANLVAVTDRRSEKISVFRSDTATDAISFDEDISVGFVPHSITYDKAFDIFYATSVEERNAVWEVGRDGSRRILVGADSEASQLLGDNEITSIHYSGNTGTLFVLCSSCGLVFEVTLSGSLRNTNLREMNDLGDVQSVSFARQGSPMLVLTAGMIVEALCQDIKPASPVLPPETTRIPGPQSWFSLFTYRFCGAWQYEGVEGPAFMDMSVNPIKRTVWAVVNGDLNEYSLRGSLLRSQNAAMLAAAGLPGVTSVAWMRGSRLVVGMREGNLLAVVDTAPREARDQVRAVYMQEEGFTDEFDVEPPGEAVEDEILRKINLIKVESVSEMGPGLLPPASLGALAYDPVGEAVLFTTVREAGTAIYRGGMDGSGAKVVLEQVLQRDGSPAGDLSNLVYSPVDSQDDYLVWCESCAKLLQVDSSGKLSHQRGFDLLDDDRAEERASSFTVTPDGSLLMIGERKGEVNFYCSTGSLEEDELVKSIREGNDSLLDPGYFWRVQNIKEDIVPVTSGDGDGTRGATSNYIFHEDVGCKDTTLGHVRSGYRITDCEDACTASLDCAAFTLNAESSVCLLKATCNSPYKQPNDLTAIKIKKDAPPPSPVPEVDFKYAEGVACTTETLRKLNSVQREQCEDVCRVDFACGAYSYDRTTRGCLLKKSCTADDATPSLAGVSGFKIVSQEQGPGYSILAGAKCTAPQLLSTLLTQSLKTCEDLCSLDARCGVYTHAEGTGRCVLRESCGATASEEGATTGRKPEGAEVPGPVPPSGPVSFNALTSVHCDDPSLAVVRGITDKQCALVCVAAKACKAFTFDPAGDCYLKPSCDDRRPARAFISGTDLSIDPPTPIPTTAPPRTPPPTAPPSSCLDSSDADGNSCVDHLLPPPPEQPSLYGGWEFNSNDDEACTPWAGNKCGLSSNPGLKIGDITWYRMFAHRANPLVDRGNGVVEWTPYRTREEWGQMYWKGSEIIGYFDKPMSISTPGEEVEVRFLWSSTGETQPEFCGSGDAASIDCNKCFDTFEAKTGGKLIYHEVRCFSGTGDFRVALTDSTRGGRVDKDGYGYWNDKMVNYRGVQWRFHPQACPKIPRDYPGGYDATAAASWIRSNIPPFNNKMNSKGLVCDFVENPVLGDRSFKERLFDPQPNGACLNLPNGQWTPRDKPFVMKLKYLSKAGGKVKFNWRMEFNGWVGQQTEEWDERLFPTVIDSIVVGYTNSRSYTSMKLLRI